MNHYIKIILLCFILLSLFSHHVKAACPIGSYYQNGLCVPPTASVCPSNSIYTNGMCRYRSEYLCAGDAVYIAGVCARNSAISACTQTPQHCVAPMLCQSDNVEVCPHKQICPQNTVLYGGNCGTQAIAQCPTGTVLQNGHCIRPSVCPLGTYYRQGSCEAVPQSKTDDVCPFGSHRMNSVCAQDTNMACPMGSTFANGHCLRNDPCPAGSFAHNGICARCPTGSQYSNGNCLQCRPGMVLRNGRCTCGPGQYLLGGDCVYVDKVTCPDHEVISDGKCIPRYCYGNKCCSDSYCNSCFASCEQLKKSTASLSKCQSNCMKDITPTVDPILQFQIKNNDLNITNLINSSNIHNIETKANTSNINNVKIDAEAGAGNIETHTGNKSSVFKIEKEEECCVVIEPRKCKEVEGIYRCYHRRHHACGKDCEGREEAVYDDILDTQLTYVQQPPETQAFLIQSPQILQQPVIIPQQQQQQQPFIVQQPQLEYVVQQQQQQQPVIVQQPQQQQQPLYIQQTQPMMMQWPQQQYQQPRYIMQQQMIPRPIVMQQPQVQQLQVVQQPNQQPCTYLNKWPFVDCSQMTSTN